MFIYVLPKEMSSPNTGGTHKITSPGSLARENLTRTFNCTLPCTNRVQDDKRRQRLYGEIRKEAEAGRR
jgi:hypothetical protein